MGILFDLDHWHEIWASLSRNRLRTALTAFGVGWGLFMLVVMLGSGTGLANGVERGFSGGATNSFFVWTRRTTEPYRGLPAGRRFSMNNGDVKAIAEQVPEAETIAPRNQLGGFRGGENVTRGLRAGGFSVTGDHPAIRAIQSLKILEGRFLNHLDLVERRKVAVIGTRVREVLFAPGEDPIDASIEIQGVYFKVIGVFSSVQTGEDAERDAQTIYVPFTTFQNAFNFGDRVGWFAITSRPGVPASVVEDKVVKLLKARHKVAPSDDRAIGHFNLEEEYDRIQGLFRGINALVWIVGIGTLSAGVIGVSNIMLIIVRERTKEIGIRRAVGATPLSVTTQVVFESVLLTSVAGYLGLVFGVAVLEAVNLVLASAGPSTAMFADPGVDLVTALRALAVLVASGVLAGLMPAWRAMRVNPVQALHAE